MSHSAVLRATSLATSGALLAAIAIAAFSMSITLRENFPTHEGVIVDVQPMPPSDPPPQRDRPVRVQPPNVPDATDMPTELPPLTTDGDFVDFDPGPIGPVAMPIITRPQWVRRPSGLTAYYPRRALDRGIEGEVALNCVVSVTGHLDCAVVSETPTGWGFGAAAIRIARDHRMVPAMRDGLAVEGRYLMRVPFQID